MEGICRKKDYISEMLNFPIPLSTDFIQYSIKKSVPIAV